MPSIWETLGIKLPPTKPEETLPILRGTQYDPSRIEPTQPVYDPTNPVKLGPVYRPNPLSPQGINVKPPEDWTLSQWQKKQRELSPTIRPLNPDEQIGARFEDINRIVGGTLPGSLLDTSGITNFSGASGDFVPPQLGPVNQETDDPLLAQMQSFGKTTKEAIIPQNVQELFLEAVADKSLPAGLSALQAGLPFLAYKGQLPFGNIFHGTPRMREFMEGGGRFKPWRNDKRDVLGWLTHGAEDPEYSGTYAIGQTKHHGVIGEKHGGGTIPIDLGAKNVLDLVEPNMDDLSQIMGAVDPEQRIKLRDLYRRARDLQSIGNAEDARYKLGIHSGHYPKPQSMGYDEASKTAAQKLGIPIHPESGEVDLTPLDDALGPAEANKLYQEFEELRDSLFGTRAEDPIMKDLPAIALAQELRLTPEQLAASPHDAIRYWDQSHKSWAWPETTPSFDRLSSKELTPKPYPLRDDAITYTVSPEGTAEKVNYGVDRTQSQINDRILSEAMSQVKNQSDYSKGTKILKGIDAYYEGEPNAIPELEALLAELKGPSTPKSYIEGTKLWKDAEDILTNVEMAPSQVKELQGLLKNWKYDWNNNTTKAVSDFVTKIKAIPAYTPGTYHPDSTPAQLYAALKKADEAGVLKGEDLDNALVTMGYLEEGNTIQNQVIASKQALELLNKVNPEKPIIKKGPKFAPDYQYGDHEIIKAANNLVNTLSSKEGTALDDLIDDFYQLGQDPAMKADKMMQIKDVLIKHGIIDKSHMPTKGPTYKSGTWNAYYEQAMHDLGLPVQYHHEGPGIDFEALGITTVDQQTKVVDQAIAQAESIKKLEKSPEHKLSTNLTKDAKTLLQAGTLNTHEETKLANLMDAYHAAHPQSTENLSLYTQQLKNEGKLTKYQKSIAEKPIPTKPGQSMYGQYQELVDEIDQMAGGTLTDDTDTAHEILNAASYGFNTGKDAQQALNQLAQIKAKMITAGGNASISGTPTQASKLLLLGEKYMANPKLDDTGKIILKDTLNKFQEGTMSAKFAEDKLKAIAQKWDLEKPLVDPYAPAPPKPPEDVVFPWEEDLPDKMLSDEEPFDYSDDKKFMQAIMDEFEDMSDADLDKHTHGLKALDTYIENVKQKNPNLTKEAIMKLHALYYEVEKKNIPLSQARANLYDVLLDEDAFFIPDKATLDYQAAKDKEWEYLIEPEKDIDEWSEAVNKETIDNLNEKDIYGETLSPEQKDNIDWSNEASKDLSPYHTKTLEKLQEQYGNGNISTNKFTGQVQDLLNKAHVETLSETEQQAYKVQQVYDVISDGDALKVSGKLNEEQTLYWEQLKNKYEFNPEVALPQMKAFVEKDWVKDVNEGKWSIEHLKPKIQVPTGVGKTVSNKPDPDYFKKQISKEVKQYVDKITSEHTLSFEEKGIVARLYEDFVSGVITGSMLDEAVVNIKLKKPTGLVPVPKPKKKTDLEHNTETAKKMWKDK